MDSFLQLCLLSDRPGFQGKAFFAAIRDVCKAISSAFDDATKNPAKSRTLQTIQAIICAVIDKAVPLTLSWVTEYEEALSLLFDNLLELFINPLVPVFLVVSERSLAYMRKSSSAKSDHPPSADYIDGRVATLAMLQIMFSHIQSALSIAANKSSGGKDSNAHYFGMACADFAVMICLLILTIVRHLQDILRDGDTSHKQSPRRRRIKRLAVKDTLWYLCSAVHFLLDLHDRTFRLIVSDSTKSFARQKQRLQLLMDTTLDIMVDLLLYQDRNQVLDYTQRPYLTTKTVVRASVEPPTLLPPANSEQAMKYFVLDDFEYRVFLCLVQRMLSMPCMP